MRRPELIVIGGSAGSLQIIMKIMTAIGPGFPIPILVVLHRNSTFESNLEYLLSSRTSLPIKEVEEKETLVPGTVYVCPADYHVLLEQDHSFSLDYSERVHYSRPSIDVSFRSAADVYGEDLLCCLLSGGNADGVDGLEYMKERGGISVVQDPATAEVPYMPRHAIEKFKVDFILPAGEIPHFIGQLGRPPAAGHTHSPANPAPPNL